MVYNWGMPDMEPAPHNDYASPQIMVGDPEYIPGVRTYHDTGGCIMVYLCQVTQIKLFCLRSK